MLNISDNIFKQWLPHFCFASKAKVESINPGTTVARIMLSNWSEEDLHNTRLNVTEVSIFSPSTYHLRARPRETSGEAILPNTALVQ